MFPYLTESWGSQSKRGFSAVLFVVKLKELIMYAIKIEHQFTTRWYKADTHWDAMELFNLLTKTCRFVQLWKGMDLVSEYKN